MRAAGRLANRYPPELRLFDRGGRRLDEVAFHPAYHALMRFGIGAGYAAVAWDGAAGGHVAHAAMVYLLSQVEPGVCCPMTMSYAAVPALAAEPEVAGAWVPRSSPALRPRGAAGGGEGGRDRRHGDDREAGRLGRARQQTRAEPDGDGWRLLGHKWFCSAPMSDAFLTLAQAPGGLSCFLVPRWTPGGARNALRLVRLKDKLGNRANASAEIEYHGAAARLIGEEGEGVRTIVEMVHHTRLDTAMAPAGLMRAALSEALWWCDGRRVFQRRLIDQPLMRSVLADLALEVEARCALGCAWPRPSTPATAPSPGSAWRWRNSANKRCPQAIYEAMECLGGTGYVEEGPMPLYYREAPLNSIWEGSGNVICLDILRTLAREPGRGRACARSSRPPAGSTPAYDAGSTRCAAAWPEPAPEAKRAGSPSGWRCCSRRRCCSRGGEPVAEAYVATGSPARAGASPAPGRRGSTARR